MSRTVYEFFTFPLSQQELSREINLTARVLPNIPPNKLKRYLPMLKIYYHYVWLSENVQHEPRR